MLLNLNDGLRRISLQDLDAYSKAHTMGKSLFAKMSVMAKKMFTQRVTRSMSKELHVAYEAETQLLRELNTSIKAAAAQRDARITTYLTIGFWFSTILSLGMVLVAVKSIHDSPTEWLSILGADRNIPTTGGLSDVEKICRALEQTANDLSLVGGVMGMLLESAHYFQNGYKTFKPQFQTLAHPGVNFPDKSPFLATLQSYAKGLTGCGHELAVGIANISGHIQFTTADMNIVKDDLLLVQPTAKPKFSYLEDLGWSRSSGKKEAERTVNNAFRRLDHMIEPLWHTINGNMRMFNKTHHHGLEYIDTISDIKHEIQAEIDRQGPYFWFNFWLRGTSPLHEAQEALMPWHYPTGDILAALQLAQYKIAQLQPYLWPEARNRSSLYQSRHKIDSREELMLILAALQEGHDQLKATVAGMDQAGRKVRALQSEIKFARLTGGPVTIPIPEAWVALRIHAIRARKSLLTIEGRTHEASEDN